MNPTLNPTEMRIGKVWQWLPYGFVMTGIHWFIHATSLFPFLHSVSIVVAMLVAWHHGLLPAAVLGGLDAGVMYLFMLGESFAGEPVVAGAATLTYLVMLAILTYAVSGWRQDLQKIRRGERRLDLLYRLVRALNDTQTVDGFFREAVALLREMLDFRHISLFVYDDQREELVVQSAVGHTKESEAVGTAMSIDEGIVGAVARSREPLRVSDVTQDNRYVQGYHSIKSELAVPLLQNGSLVGVLNVESEQKNAFSKDDVRMLQLLANELTVALERLRLIEKLRNDSITDPLTGLYNLRYLKQCLAKELDRAVRYGCPVSLLLMDVDDFKAVNDEYGHAFGDSILQAIARCAQEQLRTVDILARYGGEEFAVIMPETPVEAAAAAGKRVCAAIGDAPIECGCEQVEVTISAGVAAFPEHGTDWDTLLVAVDTALYEAKARGKNQLVLASSGDKV